MALDHQSWADPLYSERPIPPRPTEIHGITDAMVAGRPTVAAALGVDIADRHTAAGDALAPARIFLQLIPVLETKGLRSLGQVIEASASTRYAALCY